MADLFKEYQLHKKKKENIEVKPKDEDVPHFYNTFVVAENPRSSLNVYPYGEGLFFKVDNNNNVTILPKEKFDKELKKIASFKVIRAKVIKKLNQF